MAERTLVLRKNYQPYRMVSWSVAIQLWYKGKAEILASYPEKIRSASMAMDKPAVIRLLNAYQEQRRAIKFNKRNIWLRDNQKCAYCLKKIQVDQVTYDHHPIPKSHGGQTNWNNIVTSCASCNQKKGNKAPEQVGMKCHVAPHKPTFLQNNYQLFYQSGMPDEWVPYLPAAK